jgi:hypothetical protein
MLHLIHLPIAALIAGFCIASIRHDITAAWAAYNRLCDEREDMDQCE